MPDRIIADPMRLRQILTNLVSNATKFTEAGHVRVVVDYRPRGDDGELIVEVEDTGIGIAPEHHGSIFQHFVQADNSFTRRAGGTGLGLAISKQLAELMDGTIEVRSTPGVGSTFRLAIPARAGSAEATDSAAPEAELEPARGRAAPCASCSPRTTRPTAT